MALTAKLNTTTGLKVSFSSAQKPLTLRSSSSATTVGTLADIDNTTPDAGESGGTLIYNAETETYQVEKVFELNGDGVPVMDGGDF